MCRKDRKSRINSTKKRRTKNKEREWGREKDEGMEKLTKRVNKERPPIGD